MSWMIRTPRRSVPSVDEPIYMAHRSQSRLRMHSSNRRSHSGVSYSLCVSRLSPGSSSLPLPALLCPIYSSTILPSKVITNKNYHKAIGRTRRLSHAKDRSKAHISSHGTESLPSSARSPKLTEALQSRGLFIHQLLSNYIFIAPTIPGRDSNSSFAQAINKSRALSLAR